VRALQPQRGLAASTLPMAQRSQLQERLMAILDPSVQRGGYTPRKVAAVVLGVALVVLPLAAVQPAVAAQPSEDKTLPRLSKSESESRVAPASGSQAATNDRRTAPAPLPANAPPPTPGSSPAAPAPVASDSRGPPPASGQVSESVPVPDARSPSAVPSAKLPPEARSPPTAQLPPVSPVPGVPPVAPLPPPAPSFQGVPQLPARAHRVDPEDERQAMAALKKTEKISDDEDLAEALEDIAKEYNFDDEATRQQYLSAAKKLRDDEQHGAALVAFLRGVPVSVESGAEVLRQAATFKEEDARGEVLESMHKIRESQLARGPLAAQYLDVTEGLKSEDELSDALKNQMHPKAVDKAVTLRALKIAERLKSDDGKEEVLREVSDHQPIDAEVEAAYQRIAASVRDADVRKELAERLADAKSGRRSNKRMLVRLGDKDLQIVADGVRKLRIKLDDKVLKLDGRELEEVTAAAMAQAKRDMARAGIEVRRAQREMLRDRAQASERVEREELERYREESRRLEEGARELKRQAAELKERMRERERQLRQRAKAAPAERSDEAAEHDD
ncbi:MAG: hypothetical protein ACT4TC_09345, partial [Myxococcaceae bacterium]